MTMSRKSCGVNLWTLKMDVGAPIQHLCAVEFPSRVNESGTENRVVGAVEVVRIPRGFQPRDGRANRPPRIADSYNTHICNNVQAVATKILHRPKDVSCVIFVDGLNAEEQIYTYAAPISCRMVDDVELTTDDVDEIESVRQLVERLADYTAENDVAVLDEANLRLLEMQLDALHQGLSVVVAQKEHALSEDDG